MKISILFLICPFSNFIRETLAVRTMSLSNIFNRKFNRYLKNFFLILSILLLQLSSYGQKDSIREEILNYSGSKSVIISNGRELLLNNLLAGNMTKVKEITGYLVTDVADDDYMVFYPEEYWLILYWTREYQKLIESIIHFDSDQIFLIGKKIEPQNDLLLDKLINQSRESRFFLYRSIEKSNLDNVDKEFLLINLESILSDYYVDLSYSWLGRLTDDYLERYPENRYENYTIKFIRKDMSLSNWGFGTEAFIGYGWFTDDLKNSFKNNIPLGASFDFYYRQFVLFLRFGYGFGKTNRDIPYPDNVWAKGSDVEVFLLDASLGYVLKENKNMKIIPFLGIAGIEIGPSQSDLNQNSDLDEATLKFTSTYSFGLNAEIKLFQSIIPEGYMLRKGPEKNILFLRIRYSYNIMQFYRKYTGFSGNMHSITIGLGISGRRIRPGY